MRSGRGSYKPDGVSDDARWINFGLAGLPISWPHFARGVILCAVAL